MVKKFFIIFCLIGIAFSNVCKAEVFEYVGQEFDWALLSAKEKTERADKVFRLIFPSGKITTYTRKEFKEKFGQYYKDNDSKTHYDALEAGYNEYKNVNLEPYYYKDTDCIYMYALQYKNDLTKTYYYTSLGRLRFVDMRSGDVKNCPCYIVRYGKDGKLKRAAYIQSQDIMYLYDSKGKFEGVQYKSTLYTK